MEFLNNLYSSIKSRTGQPLRPATIKTYIQSINKVYDIVLGEPFNNDVSILYNYNNVIEVINASTYKHKKMLYSSINTLLRNINYDNSFNDAITNYETQIKIQANIIDDERGDNKICDTKASISMPFDEIIYRIKSFDTLNQPKFIQSKLITSFYFLNVENWVPRNNLYTLILINDEKLNDGVNNYILLNKRNLPAKIIINTSKTSTTFGKEEFKMSSELKEILEDYINLFQKQNGNYLFIKQNGNTYSSPEMSLMVSNAFIDVVGRKLNVDLIRCIIITEKSKKRMTINQRKKLAKSFQHSIGLQLEYDRHNLK
jgi:hypothetical protein